MRVAGAPGEIRTPDLLLRRQSLYPAELRARIFKDYTVVAAATPIQLMGVFGIAPVVDERFLDATKSRSWALRRSFVTAGVASGFDFPAQHARQSNNPGSQHYQCPRLWDNGASAERRDQSGGIDGRVRAVTVEQTPGSLRN